MRFWTGTQAKHGIRNEAGWIGRFTREHATGALPNGTRIRKVRSKPGDSHADGSIGVVLGSFAVDFAVMGARYFYFVEWNDAPCIACGIVDYRIAPAPVESGTDYRTRR